MSSNITLRLEKGTDLSYQEGDDNFTDIRKIYRFTEDSVTSGGAGNAYSITSVNTPQTTFDANMMFGFIASFTNSGASPTLAVDSLDPKIILGVNGDTIGAGQISLNSFNIVRYNASNDRYYLVGSAPDRLAMQQQLDDLQSQIDDNADELTDIRTTQGVAAGATNLGTFTGSTIPNSSSVKGALQSLETAVEDNESDISSVTSTANANASFIADFAAVASANPGSITIPYSTTNAIVINWGSLFVPGGQTTLSDSFATSVSSSYQAFATIRDNSGGPNDPCTIPSLSTTGLSITNNDANGHTISWIAIGRKSI